MNFIHYKDDGWDIRYALEFDFDLEIWGLIQRRIEKQRAQAKAKRIEIEEKQRESREKHEQWLATRHLNNDGTARKKWTRRNINPSNPPTPCKSK